ncbi:MAG: epimerase [Hoeflea sp.]|uniref:NAD-dependent epimerase/dehydratase family protein n=1 Tax=Hoeflea sp. TaxID=1940281 RepID=UPI000C1193E2|nr:NAD-dependent epimerase/dehydratase family protein [Hoeflea sp.]PHR25359.1 MAG: epimerase [Hoeflea sp.]
MRIIITGASGFVGNGLARHLCHRPDALGRPISKLILADLTEPSDLRALQDYAFAEWRCGDLTDPSYLDQLLDEPVDCLFHLASLPGSLAEQKPELGWSVNLQAPLLLARRLADQSRLGVITPRVVFASTIAVYGPMGPEAVTEDHPAIPAISYGAHKLMTEIGLADLSRRGEVDARSIRLPGIVARPETESGHGSAFMSLLFHKARSGSPYVSPVSPQATSWWMSLETCIANLVNAAAVETDGLPASRSWQLPSLHASVGRIIAALEGRFGAESTAKFSFEPDPKIEALFGRLPPLQTPRAEAAGFVQDEDANALVESVFRNT